MKLRVTIDPAAKRAMHDAAARALEDITDDDKRESADLAPFEEGDLAGSAFSEVDWPTLTGQVAFDTPYAVIQHEDPTLKHDDGRKAKFLEDTVEQNRARHLKYLQSKISGA